MALKTLTLHDFQAHPKRVLALGPRITSIVGPTDRGKSSILRALRWLCLNDTPGDAFVREGEKRAVVVLSTEDHAIQRSRARGQGGNAYELDDQVFKAFGQGGVPDEVAQALSVTGINFQAQHDAPFWFSQSAGEVSRQLNAIIDLSVIDSSLAHTSATVRRAQERHAVAQEREAEAVRSLEELEKERPRIAQFAKLKKTHEQLEQSENHIYRLEALVDRVRSYRQQWREGSEQAAEGQELCTLSRHYLSREQRAAELEQVIAAVGKSEQAATPPPDFAAVERTWEAWEAKGLEVDQLSALLDRIGRAGEAVVVRTEDLQAVESEFHKLTHGAACPLCGQIIE